MTIQTKIYQTTEVYLPVTKKEQDFIYSLLEAENEDDLLVYEGNILQIGLGDMDTDKAEDIRTVLVRHIPGLAPYFPDYINLRVYNG